jgi:hypothetical protein
MAGYSGTPLLRKLGIKAGDRLMVINPPKEYWDWLAPMPENAKVIKKTGKDDIDFIHIFVSDQKTFKVEFLKNEKFLTKSGMLWMSWPKKSSKVPTDLTENDIRDFGLANGLVDVKVCAVDEVWSGLKFVFRLKDRV